MSKKRDYIHNVNGQINISNDQSTINATHVVNNKSEPDKQLVDALHRLLTAVKKELSGFAKNGMLSEIQPLLEEAQQQKVPKSRLQKFKQFLLNHSAELQGFSTVCAGISAVCDVIGS
jgi:tRNA A37 N6-isopentenylltransferase MiaA